MWEEVRGCVDKWCPRPYRGTARDRRRYGYGLSCLSCLSWYQVLGTRYLVPSTWYQVLSTKYLVPSTWYRVLGTKYLVPSTWYQVIDTKY